jgi:hypothetical protein
MVSFCTAVVAIVLIGAVSEMYRARLKSGAELAGKKVEGLDERMARLENRMANIETLLLEKDRMRPFKELEKES